MMKHPTRYIFFYAVLPLIFLYITACQAQKVPYTLETITTTPVVLTRQSPTQTIFTIAPSTPTSKPEVHNDMLAGPFILEYMPGGEIFIQDISTGEVRSIDDSLKIYDEGFLGWTRNSCGFYVRLENYDIVDVDLKGNVIRKVFDAKSLKSSSNEKVSPWINISPSEELIAYRTGNGQRKEYLNAGYHYERENIIVISTDQKDGPYKISLRGGAWVYEWAPDSMELAYVDYDIQGKFQVYIADYKAKKRLQISDFQEEGKVPTKLIWTQDGKYLAILFWRDSIGWDVTIADIVTGKQVSVVDVKQVWWGENNALEVIKGDSIQWIDPENGIIQKSIEIPQSLMTPSLFGSSNKLACLWDCFGNKGPGLYIFDIEKQVLVGTPNLKPILGIVGWEASDTKFPGESNCE